MNIIEALRCFGVVVCDDGHIVATPENLPKYGNYMSLGTYYLLIKEAYIRSL